MIHVKVVGTKVCAIESFASGFGFALTLVAQLRLCIGNIKIYLMKWKLQVKLSTLKNHLICKLYLFKCL